MTTWTTKDISSQKGRVAVITGATGGLGFATALELAGAGAQVVLTGRDQAKGAAALENIRAVHAGASISYETLDLASLVSVREFAERFTLQHDKLHILVNNGGVMAPSTRQATADGFELQFGTNYLSHFALTCHLLPLLRNGAQARAVNLSSLAHRFGAAIHFEDLNWQQSYKAFPAYGQSKLAMLIFAIELQRRSDAQGWGLLSLAVHPGVAATSLFRNGHRLHGDANARWFESFSEWLTSALAQSAATGALPTLFAATSPDVLKGGYYGPTGFMELRGEVGEATVAPAAKVQATGKRLWEVSETLTGLNWPAGSSIG